MDVCMFPWFPVETKTYINYDIEIFTLIRIWDLYNDKQYEKQTYLRRWKLKGYQLFQIY